MAVGWAFSAFPLLSLFALLGFMSGISGVLYDDGFHDGPFPV